MHGTPFWWMLCAKAMTSKQMRVKGEMEIFVCAALRQGTPQTT